MKKHLTLCFVLFCFSASAQTNDTGIWSGVSIEKKITKNLSVNLNGQHRLMNNFGTTRSWIGEAGLSYKPFKGLEVSLMYRYIYFNDYKPKKNIYVYESRRRFYGDVSYQFKIKNFKIENRLRYQDQYKDNAGGELISDKSYLRYKISLDYDTDTRFTPFISSDFFYQLGGIGIDQVRMKAGVSTKITKHQSIDIAPFVNLPINDPTSGKDFVISVNYKVKF